MTSANETVLLIQSESHEFWISLALIPAWVEFDTTDEQCRGRKCLQPE